MNILNGILGVVKEHNITDIVMGTSSEKGDLRVLLGNLVEGY